MTHQPTYDEKKLAELMLYVAMKCEKHPRFGAIKLNKVLFFSDFIAYARRGRPITGAEYRKRPMGPTATRLLPVQHKLQVQGAAILRENPLWTGRRQIRLLAIRRPDLTLFEAEDIAIVDEVIENLKNKTAESVSELSHEKMGWKLAEMDAVIPYVSVFLPDEPLPLSTKDAEWAQKVVSRLSL
jgi:hypothetical protein